MDHLLNIFFLCTVSELCVAIKNTVPSESSCKANCDLFITKFDMLVKKYNRKCCLKWNEYIIIVWH